MPTFEVTSVLRSEICTSAKRGDVGADSGARDVVNFSNLESGGTARDSIDSTDVNVGTNICWLLAFSGMGVEFGLYMLLRYQTRKLAGITFPCLVSGLSTLFSLWEERNRKP